MAHGAEGFRNGPAALVDGEETTEPLGSGPPGERIRDRRCKDGPLNAETVAHYRENATKHATKDT